MIAVRSVTPAFKFLTGSQIGENKRRLCCCVADPEISIFAILSIRKNAKAERVKNILFAEIVINNELLFVRMVIDGNKSEIYFFVFSQVIIATDVIRKRNLFPVGIERIADCERVCRTRNKRKGSPGNIRDFLIYDFLRAELNDIVYHYFRQDDSLKEEEMIDTIYDLIQFYEEYLIQRRKIAKEKTNHKLASFF